MALGETTNGQIEKIPTKIDPNLIITEQPGINGTNGTMDKTQPVKGSRQVDANTSFLRAARAGDLQKMIEYLETGEVRDINASNANGLNALHLAAKDGHCEIVRELLKRGAGVDNATKKGNSALHIASLAGQKDVIKILLQHSANVNLQSQNGFTPLYMAAQENHDACVRYLLAKGANQTLATEDGFTPLAVAMQQGHEKVVAVLLESDTRGKVRLPALHIAAKKDDVKAAGLLLENEHNPDVASKSGFTPLHIAAHYGNMEVANLLIDKGADVNYAAKHNITPLHVACKWGKTYMVSLLIGKGARINSTTRDGLTPLHCAARSGHEQVIDLLLENQANILSKTKNGLAPLHMAAQGEHVEAARVLLLHNAPVDEVTVDYLTALHVAAHCGHVKVAKLLLDSHADPNARALNGFTPLHIACKKNRIKVVELLLKHGASKSAMTESGLTPLHVASFMGCMNIVIYLLQHDASPDVPTVRGETPLHLAARANQTDIIRILLRNGAQVDAKAREEQTPLHVASRLGNVDIVMLLLQHGANIDSVTKDMYTPLHIAAKEGQEEVAAILIENGARLDAATKKGFTPLHLAGKYGNINVARHLLQKGAPVDVAGKNMVTPLHVASHYDHQAVALLLLENGASPHAAAKNGHTPLHIAAKKNQMDIAATLLEYGARPDAESKAGFTPIHLAAQEGYADMVRLLLENKANADHAAKNGLTAMHLCAQEDKVGVADILMTHGAQIDTKTKAGFTPLHVAAHFGQINMVRYLLENDAQIEQQTNVGYTPLHQAAQQGHTLVINLLLKHKADPNATNNAGQTPLSIAKKLGYITVVDVLKVITEETNVTNTVSATVSIQPDEKYKVIAPESMHETFMSDSEDEGGEDQIIADHQQLNYMTHDDIINRLDDGIKMDHADEKMEKGVVNEYLTTVHVNPNETSMIDYGQTQQSSTFLPKLQPDNVDIVRHPVHLGIQNMNLDPNQLFEFCGHTDDICGQMYAGQQKKLPPMVRDRFLVSFLVDARGGAMRGCRHSGVRVIVPPKSAPQPTRITCRYVKPHRIPNPPPLMEGEALVSRVLELAPVQAKFLGPVILEVPHFASLRDKEREIIILRSDNGETWREHILYDSEEAIQDVFNDSFEAGELTQLEDLHTSRIVRIVTHDFPHFFAVVSRIRQEVHAIGPDGGTVSSAAVPQVQAVFPANALTKKIRVGLQAQPIDADLTAKLLGRSVAVSPVVTVEPRRRKFHKAINLSMPAPRAHTQGMINQYSGTAPTLRLLCSITGGQNRAIWEDVTGSTPLTFVKDCVSFTTTVSARFWLMDCRNISEACKMATDLYTHMAYVPFMVKFVVFAKRIDNQEARLSVFCMTDDKEDKTLEQQEHFVEVAKSRDVEVLEGRSIYLEFGGQLIPILKTGEQLTLQFSAFRENRLQFTVRLKDQDDPSGRVSFMTEPKVAKGEAALKPICTLNISLPEQMTIVPPDRHPYLDDANRLVTDTNFRVHLTGNRSANKSAAKRIPVVGDGVSDEIHKADIRLSDICNLLGDDWQKLARELEIPEPDIDLIRSEYAELPAHQAMVMLRLWLRQSGKQATGNQLEQALHRIKRSDIVDKCIFNLELVTDEMEMAVAKMQLDQSGFDTLKEELGPSRDTSLRRNAKLDKSFDDQPTVNGVSDKGTEEDDDRVPIVEISDDLDRVRSESILMGLSSKPDMYNQTPPPSPAEMVVGAGGVGPPPIPAVRKSIPPQAVPESANITTCLDDEEIAERSISVERDATGDPDGQLNDPQHDIPSTIIDDMKLTVAGHVNEIISTAESRVNDIKPIFVPYSLTTEIRTDAYTSKPVHQLTESFLLSEKSISTPKSNEIKLRADEIKSTIGGQVNEIISTAESRVNDIQLPATFIPYTLTTQIRTDDYTSKPVQQLTESFLFSEKLMHDNLPGRHQNKIPESPVSASPISKPKSHIPLAAKTSTPIKVKTIKKHTKLNRDLLMEQASTASSNAIAESIVESVIGGKQHPSITDINWDFKDDDGERTVTEISSLNLEDVTDTKRSKYNQKSPSIDESNGSDSSPGIWITDWEDLTNNKPRKVHRKSTSSDEFDAGNDDIESPGLTVIVTPSECDPMSQTGTEIFNIATEYDRSGDSKVLEVVEVSEMETPATARKTDVIDDEQLTVITEERTRDGDLIVRKCQTGVRSDGGSSSGSDVALHEGGAELSDDESETDIYQNNEQSEGSVVTTQQVNEFIDPVTGANVQTIQTTVTRTSGDPNTTEKSVTTTTTTQIIDEPITTNKSVDLTDDLTDRSRNEKESMQKLVDKFMHEERKEL